MAAITRNSDQQSRPHHGRSAAQQAWAAAVGCASRAWEYLTDEQRLSWNVDADTRRTSGHRRFTGINARRLRDGKELLTLPPGLEPYGPTPVLKRLLITNRHGRIMLKLELSKFPGTPITVWASRPCKQGVSGCQKCPRLGPLPPPVRGLNDITQLYFQKHGEYIVQHRMQLIGKRIFVRIRQERDEAPGLCVGVQAVVPPPEDPGRAPKKG